MSKTISTNLKSHLAGELATVASCWKIVRRDSTAYYFTDHDADLVISFGSPNTDLNGTYKAALSYQRTAIRSSSDMSVDNLEAQGVVDSTEISDADMRRGLFDNAAVHIFLVNWGDLTMGPLRLRRGTVGQVKHGVTGYTAELRGMAQILQRNVGRLYTPLCDATFGDARCTKDLSGLIQTGSVTGVTSRRLFTASGLTGAGASTISYTSSFIKFVAPNRIQDGANGFAAAGFAAGDAVDITGSQDNDGERLLTLVDPGVMLIQGSSINPELPGIAVTFARTTPGYFDQGIVTWLTGANAGRAMEVKNWSPSALKLVLPMPDDIQIGDTFHVTPGCDKTLRACIVWANSINFRGFPYVPGQDAVLDYPNGQ